MSQVNLSNLAEIRTHVGNQPANIPIPVATAGFDNLWGLNFQPSSPLSPIHFRWLVSATIRKIGFSQSFSGEDGSSIKIITPTNQLFPLALASVEHPVSELHLVASGSYGHQSLVTLLAVEDCLQQLLTIMGSGHPGLAPTPEQLLLFFERMPRRMIDAFFATPAAFGQKLNLTASGVRKYIASGRIPHTRVLGRFYVFVPGAEDALRYSLRS